MIPRLRRGLALLGAWAVASAAQAADYSFDLSEIEARPTEWNGFVEGKGEYARLRPEAALFPLSFPGQVPREHLGRVSGTVELAGKARGGPTTVYARLSADASADAYETDRSATLLEGGVRISPSQAFSIDVGKQVQRWGKGYAWNPVGFFERPKDPNDPQLSREGFGMAALDWVTSRPGDLAAVGLTLVALPVDAGINESYGPASHLNPGGRLYLLYADTDIDLVWAAKGSRPERFGLDFSRNLGTQLELHGEWARAFSVTKRELAADGSVATQRANADSWVLGLRYLTEREVTWIAEWYRNGLGFDEAQLARFYGFVDQAFGPTGTPAQQGLASALAQASYGRSNPGRDYAYLRVSGKDPFDWLYVTPALTVIANLGDHSVQVTPEVTYTGWSDVELRARAVLLRGGDGSEFGEKPASRRLELRLRVYF